MRYSDSEASMTQEFKLGEVNKFLSCLTQTTFLPLFWGFFGCVFSFFYEEESNNLLHFMLPCKN